MAKDKPEMPIYFDAGEEYRWRLVSRNGQITAGPEEGYDTRAGAEHGKRATMLAVLEVAEEEGILDDLLLQVRGPRGAKEDE